MKRLLFSMLLVAAFAFGGTVRASTIVTFGTGLNSFDMAFVPIGSPNNLPDTTGSPNPAGAVGYAYQMGQFEVSRDMITKANAAGGLGITLNDMSSAGGNGPNQPATGVSWNEGARFINWLNTSQGYQAAYNFTTGGVNDNITLWSSADAWQLGGENLFRRKDAHYWLPSMDEWYKAAYYNPTTATYSNYPNDLDIPPAAVASGTGAGTAVYDQLWATGPANITQAGGLIPYGIMALGGNVFEWEETEFDLLNDSTSNRRGIRGGRWFIDSSYMSSSVRSWAYPAGYTDTFGFRVASLSSPAPVPEPSTLIAFASLSLTGIGIAAWRRRRRS